MSGKLKVLLVALVAILLVGGIAVPIAAEDTPTPTPEAPAAVSRPDFLEKVAQKLGITKDELVTALKQARDELKATEPKPAPGALWDAFIEKVAQILGETKEEVVSAFQQAAQELRTEALLKSLEKAVAKGLITPDEAEEIKTWYASRPAAVDKLLNVRGLFRCWCLRRFRGGQDTGPQGGLKQGFGARGQMPSNAPAPQSYQRFPALSGTSVY